MIMLVRFNNGDDFQYHIFTDCENRISFVHDSVFVTAVHKYGYSWESIELDPALMDSLWFLTSSKCETYEDALRRYKHEQA